MKKMTLIDKLKNKEINENEFLELIRMCNDRQIPAEVVQTLQPSIEETCRQFGELQKERDKYDHAENIEHMKLIFEALKDFRDIFGDPNIDKETRDAAFDEGKRIIDKEFEDRRQHKILRLCQTIIVMLSSVIALFFFGANNNQKHRR